MIHDNMRKPAHINARSSLKCPKSRNILNKASSDKAHIIQTIIPEAR